MRKVLILFGFSLLFLIVSSVYGNEKDPYRIYNEYQRVKDREKKMKKKIDGLIFEQKKVEEEIKNLEYVKNKEQEMLKGGYKK